MRNMRAKLLFVLTLGVACMAFGCAAVGTIRIDGVIPVDPEPRANGSRILIVLETQPEFQWEANDGKTYDLIVNEAIMNNEGACFSGESVYKAQELKDGALKLPITLRKGMFYNWSIKESDSNQWSHYNTNIAASVAGNHASTKQRSDGYCFYVPKDGELIPYNTSMK
jgi:hypothetical protein